MCDHQIFIFIFIIQIFILHLWSSDISVLYEERGACLFVGSQFILIVFLFRIYFEKKKWSLYQIRSLIPNYDLRYTISLLRGINDVSWRYWRWRCKSQHRQASIVWGDRYDMRCHGWIWFYDLNIFPILMSMGWIWWPTWHEMRADLNTDALQHVMCMIWDVIDLAMDKI